MIKHALWFLGRAPKQTCLETCRFLMTPIRRLWGFVNLECQWAWGTRSSRLPDDHPWRKRFAERNLCGREITEGIVWKGALCRLPTHEWGKGAGREKGASTNTPPSLPEFVFCPSPLSCVKYIPWEKKTLLRAVVGEHYSFSCDLR